MVVIYIKKPGMEAIDIALGGGNAVAFSKVTLSCTFPAAEAGSRIQPHRGLSFLLEHVGPGQV